MTRRLAILIIGVVVSVLVLVGGGTLVFANFRARHTTERELRQQAVRVASNISGALDLDTVTDPAVLQRRLRLLKVLRGLLPIDDIAVLTTGPGGRLDPTQVPSTLTIDDLQPDVLARLKPVSGNHGNLVFAAAPTRESNGRLVIVVLTQRANAGLGYSVRYFFLAAAATLLLGLAVALVLGRKLTRRLRDASVATQRIAAGQLATRVPEPRPDAHDELAELARSINGMAEGLQRSKVLEQQFLLSVSHDLRTPLTSIRGYAEAITDGAADPAAAATVIKSESQRLERLVADLLDLAKVQSRSYSFQMVPVNLVEATAAVVSGFVPGAAEHGLSLRFAVAVDGAGGSPVGQAPSPARSAAMVTADPDRLAQVTS
ncbi:MAG: HAMP domain-containing sensor histidine kinase, partial [Ilumatobacteraceae bacterium]